MRKLIFIFLVILSANMLYAQAGWVEQNSGVTVSLKSVSGNWICGYSGTVLRTTNGGTNWLNVSGNGIPNTVSLVTIAGIDVNTAVTAGYIGSDTYVYRTSNAGANWIQVFVQTGGFIDAVDMTNTPNGFMAGDPVGGRWSLWKTTNNGVSWDSTGLYLPQAGAEAGWNNAMYCYQNKIWLGTNNSRIYYSSNNGTNWTTQSTGSEVNSYAVWFLYDSDGLMGGATMWITTNGGGSWNSQTAAGTGNIGGITGCQSPVDNNSFLQQTWYVRSDNKIYFSPGGPGWSTGYTAPAGTYNYIKSILAGASVTLIAVRNNGGISYIHFILSGIQSISNDIPNSFSLSQNYPNPFNPTTNIKFDIPKSGFVKLSIFNGLGQEVATLVNSELKAGTYNADWNASDYPSGIYFIN